MPDLIEPPPPPPQQRHLPDVLKPFVWTRAEAIQAAQRSVAARQARSALKSSNPAPQPSDTIVKDAISAQLRLVAEQVTRTRAVLNDDTAEWCSECERGGIQPHHRAQLLKALDSLLDRQRKLLGIPDPGSRRPSPEGKRGGSSTPVASGPWIPEAQPTPAPAAPPACAACALAPARPMGWEYSEDTASAPPPQGEGPKESLPPA